MTDIGQWLSATRRTMDRQEIPAGKARTAVLERIYDTDPDDLWSAVTSADRVSRWFLPLTGDLREGGTFSLEGNADGEILECDPPSSLRVSWLFADDSPAEVRLLLTPTGTGSTLLRLTHASVDEVFTADPDSGIWPVGTGWDISLWALDTYLRGEFPESPSPEEMAVLEDRMGEMAQRSARLWAPVIAASFSS
jgi:uncharacterized protein YndB with AHSA1/START domain